MSLGNTQAATEAATAQMKTMGWFAEQLAIQQNIAPKGAKADYLATILKSNALSKADQEKLEEDLKLGRKQLRAHTIDVIVVGTGANKIKLFDASRVRKVGITSVNNAKVTSDVVFVPNKAQVLIGVAASAAEADVINTDFVGIHTQPDFGKGELTMGVSGNKLFNQLSLQEFDTRGDNYRKVGEIDIDQSIVLVGNVDLNGEIELPEAASITALTYVRFRLSGMAAMSV